MKKSLKKFTAAKQWPRVNSMFEYFHRKTFMIFSLNVVMIPQLLDAFETNFMNSAFFSPLLQMRPLFLPSCTTYVRNGTSSAFFLFLPLSFSLSNITSSALRNLKMNYLKNIFKINHYEISIKTMRIVCIKRKQGRQKKKSSRKTKLSHLYTSVLC